MAKVEISLHTTMLAILMGTGCRFDDDAVSAVSSDVGVGYGRFHAIEQFVNKLPS